MSEQKIWSLLRRDALGVRFRRQVPVGQYVLDFYCPARRVAVEVDGEQHLANHDAKRDEFLGDLGITVIRVPSLELFPPNDRTEDWLALIWEAVNPCSSPP